MTATDHLRKVLELPTGWWAEKCVCEQFAQFFSQYLLGLHVVIRRHGNTYQLFYTGFALFHCGRLVWVTAGHVLTELHELLADSAVEIGGAGWMDGCEIPGAQSIPVGDLRTLAMFNAEPSGFDFGIASLDRAAMTLLGTQKLQILTELCWRNHETANVEGFYLVGSQRNGAALGRTC
jgi:hypothetical protein